MTQIQQLLMERFRKVIDSVITKGYRKDSLMHVGRDFTLQDGTHRTAICLFIHNYQLSGNAYRYKSPFFKRSAKEFISEMNFDDDYVEAVLKKYEEIQNSLIDDGVCYNCLLDETMNPFIIEQEKGVHIKRIYQVQTDTKTIMGGWFFVVHESFRC